MISTTIRKVTLLTFAAFAGFSWGYLSEAHADEPRFDHQVRNLFFSGFGGNAENLQQGMKRCEEVLAKEPKHAEALVWHGAGVMFLAGREFREGRGESGMKMFNQGLQQMDEAVALEPNRIGVRIPRGAVLLTTSRFMGPANPMTEALIKRGLSDYEKAYELQKSKIETMSDHAKGELLFGIAEGASRAGDTAKAETFFNEILRLMPDTPYSKRADIWLKERKLAPNQTGCIGCHVAK
jgi:tetratricopeptide (TPR) repeat protein